MTIPVLSNSNTFSELINDTQQLISLVNLLTDGPQFNVGGKLQVATMNVANLNLGGPIVGLNTSVVIEASSNLYFTAGRVRANVSNTGVANAAILYDQTNGIFSHANSTVIAGSYGDSVTIPTYIVDFRGHVTNAGNVAIRPSSTSQSGIVQLNDNLTNNSTTLAATANTANALNTLISIVSGVATSAAGNANVTIAAKNGTFIGARKTLNMIPGTNVSITMIDDAGNNQVNVSIDTIFGLGSTGFMTQKTGGVVIAANTNTASFLPGPGTNPVGVFNGANGEVQITFFANGVYDQANAAFAQANVALTYATSTFSNTWFVVTRTMPTVLNDYVAIGRWTSSTNGVHSAIISVQATGGCSILKTYVLNLANSSGPGVYEILAPTGIQSGNNSNDFEMDVLRGPATIDLRLRRTAGSAAATLDIKHTILNSQVSSFDGFIANSNTGNDPTVTTLLNTNWQANANNLLSGQIPDGRLFNAAGSPGLFGSAQIVPIIVVDTKGRVTASANSAIDYSPARNQISNTTPILYAPATGVISHATSGVAATTYGDTINIPQITVDAQGHITAVTNNIIRLASTGQFGAVRLDDTTISTSTANAATANSVNAVNNLAKTIQSSLGTMSGQSNTNVNIGGGNISGVLGNFIRLQESVQLYTPTLNQALTVDWGIAGGSNVISNGVSTITFANVVAGVVGHSLRTTNLAALNFSASANVDWGIGGLPVVNGEAVVTFVSFNAGLKVYASIQWRAV